MNKHGDKYTAREDNSRDISYMSIRAWNCDRCQWCIEQLLTILYANLFTSVIYITHCLNKITLKCLG